LNYDSVKRSKNSQVLEEHEVRNTEDIKIELKGDKFKLMPVTIIFIFFMINDLNEYVLVQKRTKVDFLTIVIAACYTFAMIMLVLAKCCKKRLFLCLVCFLLNSKLVANFVIV
jgi:hypothetical protein